TEANECSGQNVGSYQRRSGRLTMPPGWCMASEAADARPRTTRVTVRRVGGCIDVRVTMAAESAWTMWWRLAVKPSTRAWMVMCAALPSTDTTTFAGWREL